MDILAKFTWFLENMFRNHEQKLDDLLVKIEDLEERVRQLEEKV